MALIWVKQDRQLRVRQREQLRRAINRAAVLLGWAGIQEEALEVATADVARLTERGTKTLTAELNDIVATKQAEISELKKVAGSILKLAEKGDFSTPVEVTYSHTARRSSDDLITKVETVTLSDASEAESAAQTIEKRLESWGKLRDQMLRNLEVRQYQVDEMQSNVSDFAESSQPVVREIFAIL